MIGLGAGEPDFDTPDFVKEAGDRGDPRRQDQIHQRRRHARAEGRRSSPSSRATTTSTYATDQISVNVGGKHTLFNAMVATLDPGDEVVIPAPYWVSYPDVVQFAGGTPVIVAAGAGPGLQARRPTQLEAAITPRTKWLILNSPSNPTGAAYIERRAEGAGRGAARAIRTSGSSPTICTSTSSIDDFEFATIAQVCPDALRAHADRQRLLEGLCDDRLADRLSPAARRG